MISTRSAVILGPNPSRLSVAIKTPRKTPSDQTRNWADHPYAPSLICDEGQRATHSTYLPKLTRIFGGQAHKDDRDHGCEEARDDFVDTVPAKE
jgi:hypothetical protein